MRKWVWTLILGHGDIAGALEGLDREGFCFFACGVSNSQETDPMEYVRELKRLCQVDKDLHLVYFSTLAIFYEDTRYTRHKRQMEKVVRGMFPRHCILRLGSITWGRNPNVLVNKLRYQHNKGEPMEIRDVTRYPLEKSEFRHWVKLIPEWSCDMQITSRPMTVSQIVDDYVVGMVQKA